MIFRRSRNFAGVMPSWIFPLARTPARSLDTPPPFACLRKTGNALDHISLKTLSRKERVIKSGPMTRVESIELLWSVCQIPDFRKTLTDSHLHLLETVFGHLGRSASPLPSDWVADQIAGWIAPKATSTRSPPGSLTSAPGPT